MHGGWPLLQQYPSLMGLFQSVYDDHLWREDAFPQSTKVARHHWEDKGNLMNAIKDAEDKIGITKVSQTNGSEYE